MSLVFQFKDKDYIREFIVLSLISKKPVEFYISGVSEIYLKNIRRLFDIIIQITNGTEFFIESDIVRVSPGVILGGTYTFYCESNIDLSFYIEPIIIISLFARKNSSLTFFGSTFSSNNNLEITKSFLVENLSLYTKSEISLKILTHSNTKQGNAVLQVSNSDLKQIEIDCSVPIKSVGGICLTSLSKQITNRFINDFRERLNPICDKIYLNHNSIVSESPSFSVNIYGLNSNSLPIFASCSIMEPFLSAEEFSTRVSQKFLTKVLKKHTLYNDYLWVFLILMSFNSDSISTIKNLKFFDLRLLEIIEQFSNVKFLRNCDGPSISLSCIGNGFFKLNKNMV
jgi:RNA 3'-terminal phosphate cyclase